MKLSFFAKNVLFWSIVGLLTQMSLAVKCSDLAYTTKYGSVYDINPRCTNENDFLKGVSDKCEGTSSKVTNFEYDEITGQFCFLDTYLPNDTSTRKYVFEVHGNKSGEMEYSWRYMDIRGNLINCYGVPTFLYISNKDDDSYYSDDTTFYEKPNFYNEDGIIKHRKICNDIRSSLLKIRQKGYDSSWVVASKYSYYDAKEKKYIPYNNTLFCDTKGDCEREIRNSDFYTMIKSVETPYIDASDFYLHDYNVVLPEQLREKPEGWGDYVVKGIPVTSQSMEVKLRAVFKTSSKFPIKLESQYRRDDGEWVTYSQIEYSTDDDMAKLASSYLLSKPYFDLKNIARQGDSTISFRIAVYKADVFSLPADKFLGSTEVVTLPVFYNSYVTSEKGGSAYVMPNSGPGAGKKFSDKTYIQSGRHVHYIAEPDTGYAFNCWKNKAGNCVSYKADLFIAKLKKDTSLTATFIKSDMVIAVINLADSLNLYELSVNKDASYGPFLELDDKSGDLNSYRIQYSKDEINWKNYCVFENIGDTVSMYVDNENKDSAAFIAVVDLRKTKLGLRTTIFGLKLERNDPLWKNDDEGYMQCQYVDFDNSILTSGSVHVTFNFIHKYCLDKECEFVVGSDTTVRSKIPVPPAVSDSLWKAYAESENLNLDKYNYNVSWPNTKASKDSTYIAEITPEIKTLRLSFYSVVWNEEYEQYESELAKTEFVEYGTSTKFPGADTVTIHGVRYVWPNVDLSSITSDADIHRIPVEEDVVNIGLEDDASTEVEVSSSSESSSSSSKTEKISKEDDSEKSEKSSSSKAKSDSDKNKGKSSSSSGKIKAKDAIEVVAVSPIFNVYVVNRNAQILGVREGAAYAVFDMQGRVLMSGNAPRTNFNVTMPYSGTFLIRANGVTKKVHVK